MSWADNTRCPHGIPFSRECERCEMDGIVDSLKTLKRTVLRLERRRGW